MNAEEWRQITEFYRWSQDVMLCVQAQFRDRLNTVRAAGVYGAAQHPLPFLISGSF